MALRNAKPFIFRPHGLSDAIDGTNVFSGAMAALQNLVPSPGNMDQFIPRAASTQLSNFAGFTTPALPVVLLVLGDLAWGMIPTARNAGKDEPFCYNISTGAFVTISNVTSANSPTTQSTSGDWTPPTMTASAGGRITITHPGYNGTTTFIGWIDYSSFSSVIIGDTNSSTSITNLHSSVLAAGWQVGMLITGAAIPANTYIVSIAADGLSCVISNAATASTPNTTFTVTGGTPAAPLYGAGNANGQAFTTKPTAVATFSGRCWYALSNYAIYSDTTSPQQITNASQALTIGDTAPVTALAGSPLTNQFVGGIVQSLTLFKGGGALWQITGDAATTNLALNQIAGSVGTLAPNTICGTPYGTAYVAPDGLRLLSPDGVVSQPIGRAGQGVQVPFTSAVNPTRMCAAYNNNVIRITCQPLNSPGQALFEYWYDFDRHVWTGPHTFPNALIKPYYGGAGNTFVHVAAGVNGKLWQSTTDPTANSTYTENGTALQWAFQPTLLPDDEEMQARSIVESVIGIQLPSGQQITVLAADETSNQLDQQIITSSAAGGGVWGAFNWGAAVWGGASTPYRLIAIPWSQPLVCRQMNLVITGASTSGFVIGNIELRYQILGYQLP